MSDNLFSNTVSNQGDWSNSAQADCSLSLDAIKECWQSYRERKPEPEIISAQHWFLATQRGYLKDGARCDKPKGADIDWFLRAAMDWERWSVGMFSKSENEEYAAHLDKMVQERQKND